MQSSWQKSPQRLQGTRGLKEQAHGSAGPPTEAGLPRPPQAGDSLFEGGAELERLTPPTWNVLMIKWAAHLQLVSENIGYGLKNRHFLIKNISKDF